MALAFRCYFELLFVILYIEVIYSEISDSKKCYDDQCKVAIAKGVTTHNYRSPYKDVMSFGANRDVLIYSREQRNGNELAWVEIGTSSGFIPIKFIRETSVFHKELKNVPIKSVAENPAASSSEANSELPPPSHVNEAGNDHMLKQESTQHDPNAQVEKETDRQEPDSQDVKSSGIEEPDPGGSSQPFNEVQPSFSNPSLHHTSASSLALNDQQARLSDVDTPSLPNMLSTAHISVPDQKGSLVESESSSDEVFISDGQKYIVIDGTTLPSFDEDENDGSKSLLFPPSTTDAPNIPYTQPTPSNVASPSLDTTDTQSHSESTAQRTESASDNQSEEHEVNVTPTSTQEMTSSHVDVFSRSLLSVKSESDENSEPVAQTVSEDSGNASDEEEEKKGFFNGVKGVLNNLFASENENDTADLNSAERDKETLANVHESKSRDSQEPTPESKEKQTISEIELKAETVINDVPKQGEPGNEVLSDATPSHDTEKKQEIESSTLKEPASELPVPDRNEKQEETDNSLSSNKKEQDNEEVTDKIEKENVKSVNFQDQPEGPKEPLKSEDVDTISEPVGNEPAISQPDHSKSSLPDSEANTPDSKLTGGSNEIEKSPEIVKDDNSGQKNSTNENSEKEDENNSEGYKYEPENGNEKLNVKDEIQDTVKAVNSGTNENDSVKPEVANETGQLNPGTEHDPKANVASTSNSDLSSSSNSTADNQQKIAYVQASSNDKATESNEKATEKSPNHEATVENKDLNENNKTFNNPGGNSEKPSDNHRSNEKEDTPGNPPQSSNSLPSTNEGHSKKEGNSDKTTEVVSNITHEEIKENEPDVPKIAELRVEASIPSLSRREVTAPATPSPQAERESSEDQEEIITGQEDNNSEDEPSELPNHLPLVSSPPATTEETKTEGIDIKEHAADGDDDKENLEDKDSEDTLERNNEKPNEEHAKDDSLNEHEEKVKLNEKEDHGTLKIESAGDQNVYSTESESVLNENEEIVGNAVEDVPNYVVTEGYEYKQPYYESNDNGPENTPEDRDYLETNEDVDFESDKSTDFVTMLRSYIQRIINLIPDPIYSALEELTLKGVSPRVTVFTTLTGVLTLFLVSSGLFIQRKRQECFLKGKVCSFEGKLYKYVAENQVLKEELESTKNKVCSLEESLDEAQSSLLPLQDQLKKSKESVMCLETLVTSLQEDLDSSAEAGLTLNQMLSDLLTSQSQSSKLATSIQEVQAKMGAQQEAVQALRNDLSRKEEEISVQCSGRLRAEEEVDSLKLRLLQSESQLSETQEMVSNYSLECSQLKQQQLSMEEIIQHQMQRTENLQRRLEDLEVEVEQYRTKQIDLEDNLNSKDTEILTLKTAIELVEPLKLKTGTDEESEDHLKNLLQVAQTKVKLDKADNLNRTLENELAQEKEKASKWETMVLKAEETSRSLEESNVTLKQEKQKAEMELQVLTNYFKETETRMQKELGVQEAWRQQKEEDASLAGKKASDYQQEAALYRAQIKTLREELENTERSYKNQVATHEKKAHENWLAARAADRKLEETKQESTVLRQRLLLLERELESAKNTPDGIIRPIPKRPGGVNSDPTYPDELPTDTKGPNTEEEEDLNKPCLIPFSPLPLPPPFPPPPFAPLPPPPFMMPPPFREPFGPPDHWKMPPPPPHLFERSRRSPPSNRSQPSPPYSSRNASRQSSPPRRIEDQLDRQRHTFSPGSSSGGRDYRDGGISPPPALPHFHDLPPRAYHGPPSPPPHYLERMPPPPHLSQRPHRNHNASHLHTETQPDMRRGAPDMMTSSPRPRRSASPGSRNGGPATTV